MARFLLRRLLMTVPTLLGSTILVFLAVRIIPGDPVQMMLGDNVGPGDVERLRAELGLNDPLPLQYLHWLGQLVHGDFGRSLRAQDTVANVIGDLFPATFELALFSLLIAGTLGILAGTVAAIKQYGVFDNVLMIGVLFGVSMPSFWSGLLLILFVGLYLGWLPISGALSDGITLQRITGMYVLDSLLQGNWLALKDTLAHLVMPAVTLAAAPLAIIARQTRSAMLEVLHQEYMTTARAKGLSERTLMLRHALKNGLIPVVTVVGLQLGYLLSGAIITETVFARPGLGRLAIISIQNRDYPVVQGFVVVTLVVFVAVNVLVDLLYGVLDPQVRLS
jgi:peptide/nickel transport system permease protein